MYVNGCELLLIQINWRLMNISSTNINANKCNVIWSVQVLREFLWTEGKKKKKRRKS